MVNRYLLIYILRCFQNLILMEEGYRKYIQVAKTKTFFFNYLGVYYPSFQTCLWAVLLWIYTCSTEDSFMSNSGQDDRLRQL